jgi:hypothetical protein
MDRLSVYKTNWKVFKITKSGEKILCNDYFLYFNPTREYSLGEVERKIEEIHKTGKLERIVEKEARERYGCTIRVRVERRSLINGGFLKREEILLEEVESTPGLRERIIDL